MLKEEKIRLMTKLARYESGEGKEELRIARYYRSDYIGLALFRNFFLASIGYLVILLLVDKYNNFFIHILAFPSFFKKEGGSLTPPPSVSILAASFLIAPILKLIFRIVRIAHSMLLHLHN